MEKNVPKLRFPEFIDLWEPSNLNKVSKNISYGMNAAATSFDGINKYIRITDIDEESRKFIPNPITSPEGDIDEKYVLRENDIVFARTGASVGKSYLYDKEDGRILYAGFLIRFNISKCNSYFIFSQTLTQAYNKWVQVMSMRSGQPGINAEEYKTFNFHLPSLPEQTKIANFLTSVDDKISQLKKKKELLEQYKKGVMQKIFSQEIRFKDENGNDYPEWEEKKLGGFDELIHGDGDWILSENISTNGKYSIIQLGSIGFGQLIEKEFKTIGENSFKKLKGTLLQEGDLLINRMIDKNLNTCILNKDGDYITSVDVCWIRKNNYFLNGFLMYSILTNDSQVKLLSLSSGSGRVRISKKNLFESYSFHLPTYNEQIKITNFLSATDNKINHCTTQIEKMETWKKGLLQQMFV